MDAMSIITDLLPQPETRPGTADSSIRVSQSVRSSLEYAGAAELEAMLEDGDLDENTMQALGIPLPRRNN